MDAPIRAVPRGGAGRREGGLSSASSQPLQERGTGLERLGRRLLVPLGLWPAFMGLAGGLYVLVSIALGSVFLAFALAVYRTREGREADYAARRLFAFSILYLFGLFATLLVEHGINRLID